MALRDAKIQITLLGLIFFCIPGIWNSINSMAGGIGDSSSYSTATAVLYACFAVVSFFAPVAFNVLGARPTLFLGSLGYIAFVFALLYFDDTGGWFLILSGAATGVSAGLLWTAQGALVMAYPTVETKGVFVGIFWVVFNLGGVVGGVISFSTNYDSDAADATDATYWAVIAVMTLGAILIFLVLVPPERVLRPDGELVVIEPHINVMGEMLEVIRLFCDPRMLLLVPFFVYSNWFYTYQFSAYNSALFNSRTQGLNNIFYWGAQMVAAILFGRWLDRPSREAGGVRYKALLGFVFVELLVAATWVGAAVVNYNEDLDEPIENASSIDFKDNRSDDWPGLFVLYFLMGACDALVQVLAYWILGQLDQSTAVLSRFSGFYKGVQSAGAAVSWAIDGGGTKASTQLWINVALFVLSLVTTSVVILVFMRDERLGRAQGAPREVGSDVGDDGAEYYEGLLNAGGAAAVAATKEA